MDDFLVVMARTVVDTAAYLVAYRGAPVAAIAGAVLLARLAPTGRLLGWARGRAALRSVAAGAALGMTRPLARAEIGRRIADLAARPGALVAYLATSHGLTAYYVLLTGPLLGKDVLLSHVIGLLLFVLFATALYRALGGERASGDEDGTDAAADEGRVALTTVVRAETLRALSLMALGLVGGGAVAAWGLTGRRMALVELVGAGGAAQLTNALLGVGLSMVTCMVPIANLFVGTYLWKVGLAHAGLVAFLLAATVSPQRIVQYRERLGGARARKLTTALVVAAVLASMTTAALYASTPLSINYKLIPEQMW